MNCEDLNDFENSITEHENIVGPYKNSIKQKLFKDYPGAIKSLGLGVEILFCYQKK